jgi:hypothetical protein
VRTRDLDHIFLLRPSNRDFAEGKAPYNPIAWSGRAALFSKIAKIILAFALTWSFVTLGIYFSQAHQRAQLTASVRSVKATVSGCEGPGRYQHIRFHYVANGTAYDESAYDRTSTFTGGSGLIDACAMGTVNLLYLSSDPKRWSIAPLSPITRDELHGGISPVYLVAGPVALLCAGIFAFVAFSLRQQIARQERVRDYGIILDAVLIKAFEITDGESPFNLRCNYHFVDPHGVTLAGKGYAFQKGMNKKSLPVPGTRLLVLYVDQKCFEAL